MSEIYFPSRNPIVEVIKELSIRTLVENMSSLEAVLFNHLSPILCYMDLLNAQRELGMAKFTQDWIRHGALPALLWGGVSCVKLQPSVTFRIPSPRLPRRIGLRIASS